MKRTSLLEILNRNYSPQLRFTFFVARLRAAIDFFLLRTLGFSKCSRFFTSDRMPAFSHDFLNRRNADSKLSPSLIRTNATENHLPLGMWTNQETRSYQRETGVASCHFKILRIVWAG